MTFIIENLLFISVILLLVVVAAALVPEEWICVVVSGLEVEVEVTFVLAVKVVLAVKKIFRLQQ